MNDFFEGKDFERGKFKALMPEYYPQKYQKYIRQETALLKKKIKRAKRVLEAGVGIGRLIPELAPLTREFVGVDNANLMLAKSTEIARKFSNVKIVKGNLEKLRRFFPKKYFDFSLCLWNTLGNVNREVQVLKELTAVTKRSIFITVYHKGTLDDRKEWYKTVGIRIVRIDPKREIFYSESGLTSKSYNLGDIQKLAEKAALTVREATVLAGVVLWVELVPLK